MPAHDVFKITNRLRKLNPFKSGSPATVVSDGDLKAIGEWDSSDSGIDFEAMECEQKSLEVDNNINAHFDIPADIQLYWYEWILYEIDECIDDFRHRNEAVHCYASEGPAPKGSMGPLENLRALQGKYQNGSLQDPYGRGEVFDLAMDFRHLAEHRDEPMNICNLNAALSIPRILGDSACAKRLNDVSKAIRYKFAKNRSDATVPSDGPESGDEATWEEVYNTITQPPKFTYSPVSALLYHFIDSLKLASFNWAVRNNPQAFPENAHYKAYEPKYWATKYQHTEHGSQCEASKLVFLDNNPSKRLLREAFEGLVDIRNYFTHRKPVLKQREINDRSPKSRLWQMERSAVMLALLLGEVDLTLDFDVRIREFHSGWSREETAEQMRGDKVEDTIRGLMSGDAEKRGKVLSEIKYLKEESWKGRMKRRWVSFALLAEGEEAIKRAREDGIEMVVEDIDLLMTEEQQCDRRTEEDESPDDSSDLPDSPPICVEEIEDDSEWMRKHQQLSKKGRSNSLATDSCDAQYAWVESDPTDDNHKYDSGYESGETDENRGKPDGLGNNVLRFSSSVYERRGRKHENPSHHHHRWSKSVLEKREEYGRIGRDLLQFSRTVLGKLAR